MKIAVLVALLAVCCVVVVAQHPRHCDAPFEFEAHGFQSDPKMGWMRDGRIFYDARQERTALVEEVMNGTDVEYYHDIHLYRERRMYQINLKTKVCTVRDIPYRFHRWDIPRDAHFVGEAIIGTNAFDNSGLLTTHWEHRNETEHTHWFGGFTERHVGCVPIFDHFHDETIGTVHTDFYDVVLGISDPDVFIPPESCPHTAIATRTARPHHRMAFRKP